MVSSKGPFEDAIGPIWACHYGPLAISKGCYHFVKWALCPNDYYIEASRRGVYASAGVWMLRLRVEPAVEGMCHSVVFV